MRIYIFILIIFIIISSCEKRKEAIDVEIHLSSNQDYNYIYDDFRPTLSIYGDTEDYILKFVLFNDSEQKIYESEMFDTISLNSFIKINQSFMDINWSDGNNSVPFYKVVASQYYIELQAKGFSKSEITCKSNRIKVNINQENPDTSIVGNFILNDINGLEYEFIELLQKKDYVLIFNFATWCGWSKISIPIIKDIDSIFLEKVYTFGIEGGLTNSEQKNALYKFINDYEIDFPICPFWSNNGIYNVLPLDSLSFPSFLILNNERKIIYQQIGYSDKLADSIGFYINGN